MLTTRSLAAAAVSTGLPGADSRHLPDMWAELVAVWRDRGMPQAMVLPLGGREPVIPDPFAKP